MEMDSCISTPTPIARALSLPWNVGRCSVLLETGLLPSEILWEYICLKVCARILSNEDNPVSRWITQGRSARSSVVEGVRGSAVF